MKRHLAAAVVVLAATMAAGQPAPSPERTPGQLDYSPRLPRPVDAEAREALGYPPPRAVEEVLAELEALEEPSVPEVGDEPTPATLAVLKVYREALRRFHESRIDLVSELEEVSYDGPKLDELLNAKVESLGIVWQWHTQHLENHFLGNLSGVRYRHPNQAAGNRAEWVRMSAILWDMRMCEFAPRDEDIARIAELEMKLPYGPEKAGSLLLRAIASYPKDSEIHQRWLAWMTTNLPPESEGYKTASAEAAIGQPLAVQGQTLDGGTLDTREWKGDVVVIDVWGMWCQPCVESMPELKRVYDAYRDRGLKVVGVFADWRPEPGKAFLAEHNYDWPQIVDPSIYQSKKFGSHAVVEQLHIRGYPTVLIIDRDGILRVRDHFPDLEAEVARLLEPPAKED